MNGINKKSITHRVHLEFLKNWLYFKLSVILCIHQGETTRKFFKLASISFMNQPRRDETSSRNLDHLLIGGPKQFLQGPFFNYVRLKGQVGGEAKSLSFLTEVDRWLVPPLRKVLRKIVIKAQDILETKGPIPALEVLSNQ